MTSIHGRRTPSDPDRVGEPARGRPEVWLFIGMAAFGLLLGTVYWFVTYEPAGTVLLGGFGVAAAVAAALLVAKRVPGAGREPDAGADEHAPPSLAGWGPLVAGLGLAVVGLGLILGPVLAIPGALIAIAGGRAWLAAVERGGD